MYIKSLQKTDIAFVYPCMEVDFPDNERKPQKMIEDSFDTGFMEGYGYYEGEALIAYALFVKIDEVLLLDYLAVLSEHRGSGVGSAFLKKLHEQLMHYECIICEVENPEYCEDTEEQMLMERRIRFYLRNGVRDTGASGRVYGVEYRFLEFENGHPHSPEEAKERIGRFYHTYWASEEEYKKYVRMH